MLAEIGYVALAVDMFGNGKTARHPDDAKKFASEAMKNKQVSEARFNAALDFIRLQPSVDPARIAAIGYCFGGGVVLHMARTGSDLKGVVSFHGSLATDTPAQSGAVKAKVLVFNGEDDKMVPAEQVAAFKEEMTKAGASFRYVGYPGVKHSFTNPDADEYARKFNLPLAYDKKADRFVVTQLGGTSAPFSECIAVSQTSDPGGAYWLYSYAYGTTLNDYPKFGVWPDGYYMSDNVFNAAGTQRLGQQPFAVGLLGGDRGAEIRGTLAERGIQSEFVTVPARTRQCITLIDQANAAQTELVEEGRPVDEAAFETLRKIISARMRGASAVVMSGTIAPGIPASLYADCTRLAREAGVLSVVDAHGTALELALRERPGDIPALVRHFIVRHRAVLGSSVAEVSDEALHALARCPWRGNVRELENALERAAVLADTGIIEARHLPDSIRGRGWPGEPIEHVPAMHEAEYEAIVRAASACQGNLTKMAEMLGIGRTTLWRKMKSSGMRLEDFRSTTAANQTPSSARLTARKAKW